MGKEAPRPDCWPRCVWWSWSIPAANTCENGGLAWPGFIIFTLRGRRQKCQHFNGVLRINPKPHQIQSAHKNPGGTKGWPLSCSFAALTSFHKTVLSTQFGTTLKISNPNRRESDRPGPKQVDCGSPPFSFPGMAVPLGLGEGGSCRPNTPLTQRRLPPSSALFKKEAKRLQDFKAEASKILDNIRGQREVLGACFLIHQTHHHAVRETVGLALLSRLPKGLEAYHDERFALRHMENPNERPSCQRRIRGAGSALKNLLPLPAGALVLSPP